MTVSPIVLSTNYGFVRSRQLDGTFPGDRSTGIWPITANRVARGWGNVPESEWPRAKEDAPWPPPEPPGLDQKAKANRILRYQRVNGIDECKLAIQSHGIVQVSLDVTAQWDHADKGVIELPSEGTELTGVHAIRIHGWSDKEQRFNFANSWGVTWGDKGFGSLPYEYFDYLSYEAWICEGTGLKPPLLATAGIVESRWATGDFANRVFHGRELHDVTTDERLGWTFAVQHPGCLDVEELFVRPQFRQKGYGRRLLQMLLELSSELNLPLRFLIPYPDCKPNNLPLVKQLLSKEGYCLLHIAMRSVALEGLRPISERDLPLELPLPPSLISPASRLGKKALFIPEATGDAQGSKPQPELVNEANHLLSPGTAKVPDPTASHTFRLTFAYDGPDIRLTRCRRLEMVAPPSVTQPPERGHVGYWFEVRDAAGNLLYHRHLHQPIRTDTEAFGSAERPAITRAVKARPNGQFTLLVPDLPRAHSFHFFGPVNGKHDHRTRSEELFSYSFEDLRQHDTQGTAGSADGEAHA